MQYLNAAFLMSAGIGFILGLINVLIWSRMPRDRAFLFAGLMAFGAGGSAICEVLYLGEPAIEAFRTAFVWQGFFIVVTLVSMVWFLHYRLGTGAVWLCWLVTAIETIALIPTFMRAGGGASGWLRALEYRTTSWGEAYAVPAGQVDATKYIADLGTLLIVIYVVLGFVRALKRGRTTDALTVSAPVLFFIVIAGIHTPLVDERIVETPYLISVIFVAISLSLAIGLVDRVARGARANRELEAERLRWRNVLDVIGLAVIRVDANGRIAYVNPFLERVSGFGVQDVQSRGIDIFFPKIDAASARKIALDADRWTGAAPDTEQLATADGQLRHLIWRGVALTDIHGAPNGLIAIGEDVTDQRRIESERDNARRDLNRLSRAMTLGELAATFAHELSQPISAVLSNAQTLDLQIKQGVESKAETEEILGDILSDTRRARDLMDRVRSFMYNEQPEFDWFDPQGSLDEVLDWIRPEAARRNVTLQTTSQSPPARYWGSELEIQEVMINLILNAIQAAQTGAQKSVNVTLGGAGDALSLVVEDGGPGIEHDDVDTLFVPFVSSKKEGTGIGLAVVRRIVERHRGNIDVERSAFGGACFRVSFPSDPPAEMYKSA